MYNKKIHLLEGAKVLTIASITVDEAGNYTCVAYTPDPKRSEDQASATIDIRGTNTELEWIRMKVASLWIFLVALTSGWLFNSFRYNGFWDREEKCDVSKIQLCEIMGWLAYSERTR